MPRTTEELLKYAEKLVQDERERELHYGGKGIPFDPNFDIALIAELSAKLREREFIYYKHYKGGLYKLLGFGAHESTKEPMVMYMDEVACKVWVRPEDEFHQKFTRFRLPTPPKKEKADANR